MRQARRSRRQRNLRRLAAEAQQAQVGVAVRGDGQEERDEPGALAGIARDRRLSTALRDR